MGTASERDLIAEVEACKRILQGDQHQVRKYLDLLSRAHASLVHSEGRLAEAEEALKQYRNRML